MFMRRWPGTVDDPKLSSSLYVYSDWRGWTIGRNNQKVNILGNILTRKSCCHDSTSSFYSRTHHLLTVVFKYSIHAHCFVTIKIMDQQSWNSFRVEDYVYNVMWGLYALVLPTKKNTRWVGTDLFIFSCETFTTIYMLYFVLSKSCCHMIITAIFYWIK